MCGEQLQREPDFAHLVGSPPRVRGTDIYSHRHGVPLRITPACAGNRPSLRVMQQTPSDHPRVCGEQAGFSPKKTIRGGSPPRVRGTEKSQAFARRDFRITPACAGNRSIGGKGKNYAKDHPRVCGEQRIAGKCKMREVGSPPRVRGTEVLDTISGKLGRITPACAGNRLRRHYSFELLQDHPRVCGEQAANIPRRPPLMGSPPRVRGTDNTDGDTMSTRRITPACAGNSIFFPSRPVACWDHPRVCGEQT